MGGEVCEGMRVVRSSFQFEFFSFFFEFQLLLGFFSSWVAPMCREEGEGSEEEILG